MIVAGVFNRCRFYKDSGTNHNELRRPVLSSAENIPGCCRDPVVYQRINEEIRQWIWEKAPGVRDSSGCKKNEIKSILLREQLKKVRKFLQLLGGYTHSTILLVPFKYPITSVLRKNYGHKEKYLFVVMPDID